MEDKNRFERKSRIGTILIGIGILIILAAMVTLTFHSKKTDIVINAKQDTILAFKEQIDSVDKIENIKLSRKDSIIKIVRNYIKIHHENNDTSKLVNTFYTDTIQQYFGDKNITFKKLSIIRNKKLLDRPYDREAVKYTDNDIHIDFRNDTTDVFINILYFKDSMLPPQELIYKIKFNKEKRIFFVKDYLPKTLK